MSLRIASLALAAVVMTANIETAQAGFWTDVAKGTVKNAARHGKATAQRVGGNVLFEGVGGAGKVASRASGALNRLRNR